MNKLLILILVALVGYVVFVYKPNTKNNSQAEGTITKTYDTYTTGVSNAKSAVSAIEERNKQN